MSNVQSLVANETLDFGHETLDCFQLVQSLVGKRNFGHWTLDFGLFVNATTLAFFP